LFWLLLLDALPGCLSSKARVAVLLLLAVRLSATVPWSEGEKDI
jgi:hypothetical protein